MAENSTSEELAAELKAKSKQSSAQNTQRVSGIFDNPKSGGSKPSINEKKIFEGAAIERVSPPQDGQPSGIKNVDQLSRPVINKGQSFPQEQAPIINDEDDEDEDSNEEPFGYDLNTNYKSSDKKSQPSRTDNDLKNLKANQLEANNLNEEVAGGQAIPTAKPSQIEGSSAGKSVTNKTGQAGKKAVDASKQLAKLGAQAAKAAAAWLKVVFSNPVALVVAALVIALIIFIGIFILSRVRNAGTPSGAGKSTERRTNPIADKEWIQQVLLLAGDKDTSKLMSDSSLNKMKNTLANIKTEIEKDSTLSPTDKANYIAKIDLILPKIDNAKLANDANKKKILAEIVTNIGELSQIFLSVSVFPSSLQTSLPVKVTPNSFNTHPHLGTAGWPSTATPKDYPSPARTFLQTGNGTCDAVDLKVGGNIDVFAAFGGKITKVSGAPAVENSENKVIAIYGHVDLDGGLSTGKDVKAGDHIGKIQASQGHLHFELARGNSNGTWKCVTNSRAEVNSAKAANWPENQLGKTLWDKMVLVLHSPN